MVNEAPFILDGLLMNEAGRLIRGQYADTESTACLVHEIAGIRCRLACHDGIEGSRRFRKALSWNRSTHHF